MQPLPRTNAVDGTIPLIRFERELTVGGIGTLWLGRLAAGSEAGRTVLLRRMSTAFFSDKDIEALKKVAEAYSKVRHPSLVKLLGVVEQGDDIISVSEHLDGVRLCDLMRSAIDRDSPLPATVAVRIVLDAARATLKAHRLATESGLFPTERLFVPEGVFIAAYGGTLLAETGVLSTIVRCPRPRSIPDVAAQLAPEELERATSTKGSPEVFSLGVLLWEALANRYLFARDQVSRTLEDLRAQAIAPLAEIERCGLPVPDALAEVVRVATNRHPGQRFADVAGFVAALEELPVHFLATEHHVASALRDQAAELLRESHADPSQSSLMVAFSEVPASRLSTCPPPDDGHNWEPPTFAQRRLLGGAPVPANSVAVREAPLPSTNEPLTSGAMPQPLPLARARWHVVGLVVALLAIAISIVVVRAVRTKAQATPLEPAPAQSAPAAIPPNLETGRTQSAALPDPQTPAGVAEPQPQPSSSSTTEPTSSHSKKPSLEAPSGLAVPESKLPPSARKSDQTYRPRQIAPYRPKGI